MPMPERLWYVTSSVLVSENARLHAARSPGAATRLPEKVRSSSAHARQFAG